jgi:polar amino acid transport system substrate-binding protein
MGSRSYPRASIALGLVATLSLGAAAVSAQSPEASSPADDGSLARVQADGLYVAFVGENPWSFLAPDGTFTGAEAEMVKECAATLGITELYPVNVQFDGLLPGLEARRYDMIAAGMSIREARLEVANSTQLLYRYGTRPVGMKGDPILQEITSWTALGESGIPIAGIRGSTEITDTEQFGVEWLEYPDNPTELADLLAGRIKLMAWNDNYYGSFIKENPDVPIEAVPVWDYEGVVSLPGHYFNKEDITLRDAFNDCYSDLKTSGRMAEILTEWGFNPDTIPEPGPGFPPGFPEG